LYDPTEGTIRLDGHDLRDLKLESLAAAIGMSRRRPTFSTTPSPPTSPLPGRRPAEDIEAAAQAANIHNFIMDLPERYNTIVR